MIEYTEADCPHIRRRRAGDEVFEQCEINEGRLCDYFTGNGPCEEWLDIKREWESDDRLEHEATGKITDNRRYKEGE